MYISPSISKTCLAWSVQVFMKSKLLRALPSFIKRVKEDFKMLTYLSITLSSIINFIYFYCLSICNESKYM